MWSHYDVIYVKTVQNRRKKKKKERTICFLPWKTLGKTDIHRVCGNNFLELIAKYNKFGTNKKMYRDGWTNPVFYFWTTSLLRGGR